MSRIVVTGIGIISAIGGTPDEVWSALESGRSGLGRLTRFPSARCGHFPVAEVHGDLAALSAHPHGSRSEQLIVYAARAAFHDARLHTLPDRRAVGVVLGNCTGGMDLSEEVIRKLMTERSGEVDGLRRHECAWTTNAVAEALDLGGFRATVSEACASGAMGIGTACDALDSGEAQIVLAGGVDALTRVTLNGFCSLLNVSAEGCRPFDAERTGMNLGEGAGALVLETAEHAAARGATVLAELAGYGATCDAYHATAPLPDGEGARRAMALALAMAGLEPAQVDYLNAHGTGTLENDAAEAQAIGRLFGARAPLVSSTKRFFGHTLAAAGAIEAILCILAIRHQRVPPNLGLRRADPAVTFPLVTAMQPARVRVAMSNSFGFGGENSVLVLAAPGATPGGRP